LHFPVIFPVTRELRADGSERRTHFRLSKKRCKALGATEEIPLFDIVNDCNSSAAPHCSGSTTPQKLVPMAAPPVVPSRPSRDVGEAVAALDVVDDVQHEFLVDQQRGVAEAELVE
jgi:hypothetical protein